MFDYSYLKGRIAGYETIYSFDEIANKAGMNAEKLSNVLGIEEDRLTESFFKINK